MEEIQHFGGLDSPELIGQILWKLGFEIPRFNDSYERLRSRLQHFSDAVLGIGQIRTENDREKIRSAGVNLFVSIEQILEEIISYNVWLLSSDHFLETRYYYNLSIARNSVSKVIGSSLQSGDSTLYWDSNGQNTLGVLYRYLQELGDWSQNLLGRRREDYLRPDKQIPHYAKLSEKHFSSYYTEFWANTSPGGLVDYVQDLNKMIRKFGQANVSEIRNGLDHQRHETDFPDTDVILAFVAKFREAFDHADLQKYIPKEFWAEEQKQDRYSRYEYIFSDYAGRKAAIYEPSFNSGIRSVDLNHPILIAPGSLLGQHTALTFGIRESSSFSEYWKDYPRLREIPQPIDE